MDLILYGLLEERGSVRSKARMKYSRNLLGLPAGIRDSDFLCLYCRQPVNFNPLWSGVNNRNHCPHCLWSRHLDLIRAGDRLSACKALMMPVGLAVKRTRKKYGKVRQGELMVIHLCVVCGKASINRIAADDDSEILWDVFEGSFGLETSTRRQLAQDGIVFLEPSDVRIVRRQISGTG